ncbi:MAG: 2,3-bisphosphoglycerate-dependent phosphoglycerate mutase [Alphaproteobacteria bacterium MarineAlpha5_Bin9]|nr:MAG: 2,3-bisphosphoglycerate-dependent phosphoglycerate mutase [Alphaproteobacteria bacterium MarineAlpha5_Bin9]|tara:strand:- start:4896 stop:5528 length:633 start_codon:yes stop_codon:yes gene_type:complete
MNSLIILRHGQSQWNLENRFTGWKDVPLTEKGINEAIQAGKAIKRKKIKIDIIFSSTLQRANETAILAIKQIKQENLWDVKGNLIMQKDNSLNERDYGKLVGLNKKETAKEFGKKQVHIWRRSYDVAPPGGESLKEVVERVNSFYIKNIESNIKNNKNVLVVAHGNSLRALLICIKMFKPKEISKIEIPTGNPFVISYKDNKLIKKKYLI